MTKESIDAAIERRNKHTKAIFVKAAQEKVINPSSVGRSVSFSQYNLHNYRLYFNYKKSSTGNQGSVGDFTYIGSKNYGSEKIYKHNLTGWTVTLKKTQAELRKKHEVRDWHLIDNSDVEKITQINQAKRNDAVSVFKAFVKVFGGDSDFIPINEYKLDNAIKNTITQKIPEKAAWEDEVSKKLYMEDKIEMKNELYAKNFCHNAGLKDFSPEISNSLDSLYLISEQHKKAFEDYAQNIRLHLDVLKDLKEAIKELRQGIVVQKESTSHLWSNSSRTSFRQPPKPVKRIKCLNLKEQLDALERGITW